MKQTPVTSMTLLNLATQGDEAAWERLTEIYGPIVLKQCLRKGLNDADAHDVTQNVFVSVHKSLHRFKKEDPDQRFLSWLKTIVARRLIDFWRKQNSVEQPVGGTDAVKMMEQIPELEFEWDEDVVKKEVLARAVKLMKKNFSEHIWQAFYMTAIEGKTTEEVAELLEMNSNAVRQARFRVRKRLVADLGDVVEGL